MKEIQLQLSACLMPSLRFIIHVQSPPNSRQVCNVAHQDVDLLPTVDGEVFYPALILLHAFVSVISNAMNEYIVVILHHTLVYERILVSEANHCPIYPSLLI